MSDYIMSLPTDDQPMNPEESHLFDSIIKPGSMNFHDLLFDFKDSIILGGVFFAMNMDGMDGFIQNIIPYAKSSPTSLLVCKTLLFIIIAFLLRNHRLLF